MESGRVHLDLLLSAGSTEKTSVEKGEEYVDFYLRGAGQVRGAHAGRRAGRTAKMMGACSMLRP